MQAGMNRTQILDALQEKFPDIDRARMDGDLAKFLQELAESKVITSSAR
jgi:hypothetical protein